MLEHVELIAATALTLGVIHGESSVADDSREGDAVTSAEVKAIAADSLPGEFASNPEPADIATEEEFVSGRHRVTHARADHRIGPVDGPGPREGARPSEFQVADVEGAGDLER